MSAHADIDNRTVFDVVASREDWEKRDSHPARSPTTEDFDEYVAHYIRHSETEGAFCYPNEGLGASLQVWRAPGSGAVEVLVFPSQADDAPERPDPVVVETCPIEDLARLSRIIRWYSAFWFEPGEAPSAALEYTGARW